MGQALAYAAPDIGSLIDIRLQLEASQLRALEILVAKLEAANPDGSTEEFAGLFDNAQRLLGLSDLDLSRALKVSRPTIGRWSRGESSPHRLIRKAVFGILTGKARAKARMLRS